MHQRMDELRGGGKLMKTLRSTVLLSAIALVFTLVVMVPTPAEALTAQQKRALLLKKKKAAAAKKARAARLAKIKARQAAAKAAENESQDSEESEAVATDSSESSQAVEPESVVASAGRSSALSEGSSGAYASSAERSALVSSDRELERQPSASSGAPYALQIVAGPRAFGRNLSWNDDLFQRMVGYRVLPAMALGVSANWYPLAHVTEGVLSNFGLTGSFDTSVGLGTRSLSGVYGTSFTAFEGGLQFRLPFNGWQLGAVAAYGQHNFKFQAATARTDLPPDVSYGNVRTGLFATFELLRSLDLNLQGSYLFVLNPGMIRSQEYFPRASVGGIDIGAGVDYRFTKSFGVGVSAGLRRYFYDMRSQPGDLNVAGGAVDQYPTAQFRILYRL